MLDSLNLEARGVRTITFVTPPFVPAAEAIARTHGRPDLALIIVEEDDVADARISEETVDRVIALLRAAASP